MHKDRQYPFVTYNRVQTSEVEEMANKYCGTVHTHKHTDSHTTTINGINEFSGGQQKNWDQNSFFFLVVFKFMCLFVARNAAILDPIWRMSFSTCAFGVIYSANIYFLKRHNSNPKSNTWINLNTFQRYVFIICI